MRICIYTEYNHTLTADLFKNLKKIANKNFLHYHNHHRSVCPCEALIIGLKIKPAYIFTCVFFFLLIRAN